MTLSRRQLFRRALQVAPVLILPELILPKRKVFAVGWANPIIIELQNEHWNDSIIEWGCDHWGGVRLGAPVIKDGRIVSIPVWTGSHDFVTPAAFTITQ